MPDQKLTALTALASLSADDLFYVVDDPAGAATPHKMTASVLDAKYLQAADNLSDLANAGTARTNLGLAIGTNVQAYDAFLTSIAGLGTAADKMIYTTGIDTAAETGLSAFARSFLDDASEAAFKATVNLEIGVDVQAWDADLDTIAGLAKTDGNFIVGDGAAWVVESGATARTSLGLGSIATQAANSVSITGGSITGITDLAIADGGTGQSTAQAAIDALSNVAVATNEHVLTKDTATGNAIFKAAGGGGSSLPVADTQTLVMGSADNTKLLRFEIDGFTAGETRVMTPPNQDTTLAGLSVAQAFSVPQTITIGSGTDIGLVLNTAGATPYAMVVANLGRIGIGTYTPAYAIDIYQGTIRIGNDTAGDNRLRIQGENQFQIGLNNSSVDTSWLGGTPTGGFAFSNKFGDTLSTVQQLGGTDDYIIDGVAGSLLNSASYHHNSSTTPTTGFGVAIRFLGQSSTTASQTFGRLTYEWATATHASRKALSKWTVFDTAEREGIRIEASGSAAMLGVLGATAIARQAHIVDADGNLADITTKFNTLLAYLENFGFIATS